MSTPTQDRWRAPSGDFSLTIPDGWRPVEISTSPELNLLGIVPETSGVRCYVGFRGRWASSLTQDEVNAALSRDAFPDRISGDATRVRFDTALVDGVLVITNVSSSPATGATQIDRRFMIARDGHVSHYVALCDADQAMPGNISDDANAFVSSLTFVR